MKKPPRNDCCDAIIVKQTVHDPAKREGCHYLGNYNEEIEDPHVDARFLLR